MAEDLIKAGWIKPKYQKKPGATVYYSTAEVLTAESRIIEGEKPE